MKGFIKFISILIFGFLCFVGGVAKESGHKTAAIYCVFSGTLILINGFTGAIEMETQEIIENSRKKDRRTS